MYRNSTCSNFEKNKVWVKKVDKFKNWPLIENPQFSLDYFMFQEYKLDWIKIVGFFINRQVLGLSTLFYPHFMFAVTMFTIGKNPKSLVVH